MTEQLNIGVELMLIGMGIVFLFLVLLIAAVNLMSAVILRYFPDTPAIQQVVNANPSLPNEKSTIAAISAAVHQHRAKHR